jgi:2-polyprenyl-6-methoxyphenol hydroxylase-like FAD-dependent oxidoreductase
LNVERLEHCDVLIVGAGLAGVSLARQLLLESDKSVRLVERRATPTTRQKVGEATVQVSAYYFAKVLQMEEHLLREHFMKYNLRFHWPAGAPAEHYDGYSQSYIRPLSNIATYQLDRNKFEAELLRVNRASPRFTFEAGVKGLEVELRELDEPGPHAFRYEADGVAKTGTATWVVDASGRGRFLARKLDLSRETPIRHGSTFAWVDGLVDIEKLTGRSAHEVRTKAERAWLGHLPPFLATNHFCGEGFWFWVIPLHGRTSLGLVYDPQRVPRHEVDTPEKMIAWVCRRFPLFAEDLPQRPLVAAGSFADFALDGAHTLSERRFALVGEAGRFSDPLYSPGGDLIALYNTLVCDAIAVTEPELLPGKVRLYEQLARSFYEAYVPSYAVSYDTLGDQECFSLRYTWELAVYFAFYVFPFVNGLFTQATFSTGYLRRFGQLGPANRALHAFLTGYYHWKKARGLAGGDDGQRVYLDFMESGHLRAAEACFYQVGLDSEQARRVLDGQVRNLDELARWIVAQVTRRVTGDARALSAAFVDGLDFEHLSFDPVALQQALAALPPDGDARVWRRTPTCLARFRDDEVGCACHLDDGRERELQRAAYGEPSLLKFTPAPEVRGPEPVPSAPALAGDLGR